MTGPKSEVLVARGIRKRYDGRPLLLGRWPQAPLLHLLVLLAYGVAGLLIALRLFRRRLMR